MGESLSSSFGARRGTVFKLVRNGSVVAKFDLAAPGKYRVTVRAWGEQLGYEAVRMRVRVAGRELLVSDVPNVAGAAGDFSREIPLVAGPSPVEVAFLNDAVDRSAHLDRNLVVDRVQRGGARSTRRPRGTRAASASAHLRRRARRRSLLARDFGQSRHAGLPPPRCRGRGRPASRFGGSGNCPRARA